MSKSANKKDGFTVIEATIAIFILLIGLLAVGEFFPLSLRLIKDAQKETTATNIAISKMEEVRSLSYEEIGGGVIEEKQRVSSNPASYLYFYQRQASAQTLDADLAPSEIDLGLKRITVIVYWYSLIGSKEKSIQIDSLISDY